MEYFIENPDRPKRRYPDEECGPLDVVNAKYSRRMVVSHMKRDVG
jgi:hypothetical protein